MKRHAAQRATPAVAFDTTLLPVRDFTLAKGIATASAHDVVVTASNGRTSRYPILDVILERQSRRAFGPSEISAFELETLLEAARWAPSSFNAQPWRFVVSRRGTEAWTRFLAWVSSSNREWAARSAALVLLAMPHARTRRAPHAFDVGAAWACLALQAAASGLIAHAIAGFDFDRAEGDLAMPEPYEAACLIAIGRPGTASSLPDRLRERERASGRLALEDVVFEAEWGAPLAITGRARRGEAQHER